MYKLTTPPKGCIALRTVKVKILDQEEVFYEGL